MSVVLAAVLIQSAFANYIEQARALKTPELEINSERDYDAFWETNRELLKNAWGEYPKKYNELYSSEGVESYLNKTVVKLCNDKNEDAIWKEILQETEIEGVLKIKLFDDDFGLKLIDELEHLRKSGIPTRRPNSMNRYGFILEDVGLGVGIKHVMKKYFSPLAQMIFPTHITDSDTQDHYSFTIRYKEGEDLSLAPHTDASSFTVNLCLGISFEGGDVTFYENGNSKTISSVPGVALIHRGMLRHSASLLTTGERHNLVMWVFGIDGYVRVAPYPIEEQSTPQSRWKYFDNSDSDNHEL